MALVRPPLPCGQHLRLLYPLHSPRRVLLHLPPAAALALPRHPAQEARGQGPHVPPRQCLAHPCTRCAQSVHRCQPRCRLRVQMNAEAARERDSPLQQSRVSSRHAPKAAAKRRAPRSAPHVTHVLLDDMAIALRSCAVARATLAWVGGARAGGGSRAAAAGAAAGPGRRSQASNGRTAKLCGGRLARQSSRQRTKGSLQSCSNCALVRAYHSKSLAVWEAPVMPDLQVGEQSKRLTQSQQLRL